MTAHSRTVLAVLAAAACVAGGVRGLYHRSAMHETASMRVRERPSYLAQDARCFGRRQWTARTESLAERLAFNVAHDEEDEAANLAHAMDRDDMRV